MTGKGKITITEIFLLLGAAVFLVLVLGVHLWNMHGEKDSWSVRTQKTETDEPTAAQSVDINTADMAQLQQLEGVGPVLAQRIIDWRTANGGFASIEDLLEVEGVGETTLENMRDQIIIGDTK